MDNRQYVRILQMVVDALKAVVVVLLMLFAIVIYMGYDYLESKRPNNTAIAAADAALEITNGIHVQSGLVEGEGLKLVIQNCTPCHSAKLITQNRMTETGWKSTIQWMQETQNLWDLGDNESSIINYLANNYAPQKKGRRAQLENIEWYEME
ncbi:cytochrome C [Ekhidna sp.]|uniref:cytochrome C n=1 Tax=Ekhidna sp. TaxID=2608089 RepID=UPI00329A3E4F